MVQVETFIAAVRSEAAKIDEYMRADLARLEPATDKLLLEVLDYGLFNGGKRIRPLLVVFSSRLCGNGDDDVYRLGSAFEYLHAATLFHDDIIDNSETRRGKKSVHTQFGTVAAILAGDFLHALAMSTVGRFAGSKGLEIFCNATTGMVDGEFMQLRNATKHNLSEPEYYDAIMMKTGLLIAAACEIGAIYGGGTSEQVKALRDYGVNLGCAFQIIDDLLDYLGDPNKTGKAVGNDLIEGKVTLPLILALNGAAEKDRERLLTILATREERAVGVQEVSAIIEGVGGFTAARKKAVAAVANAITVLQVFSEPANHYERNVLEGLARYVLTRDK
ncbi:MAG: polyprenyl synthetase family protein [Proteobacteria bacterium]|nr:polyprenyl synthetase family protein [Pseudomonadota bacterium]